MILGSWNLHAIQWNHRRKSSPWCHLVPVVYYLWDSRKMSSVHSQRCHSQNFETSQRRFTRWEGIWYVCSLKSNISFCLSEDNMARLADAFFPESRDHVGSNDEFKLEGERYAVHTVLLATNNIIYSQVMRSIEEIEIQAAKNRVELPRDPFNNGRSSDGPRFHQSSHERERGDDKDRQRDREYLKTIETPDRPIRPTILHRGQQSQQMSAPPMTAGNPCLRKYQWQYYVCKSI